METYLLQEIKSGYEKEQDEQFKELKEQDHINITFPQNSKFIYFSTVAFFMQLTLLCS